MRAKNLIRAVAAAAIALSTAIPVGAQVPNSVKANWALAEKFRDDKIRPITYSTTVNARFIGESDSMWYNWRNRAGSTFYLVVPQTRTKRPLFDHENLVSQLSILHRHPYDKFDLPFTNITFTDDHKGFQFNVDSLRYEWTLATATLKSAGRARRDTPPPGGRGGGGGRGGFGGGRGGQDFRNYSPDSTAFAFAREHNLFVVEVSSGDTMQVSSDGVEDYSFGARDTTQNQQQQQQDDEFLDQTERQEQQQRSRDPRVRASVTWSPDSKAFSVTRRDQRKVADLYLVNVLADPRPALVKYKYSMPGEENVPQTELFTYRRGESKIVPVTVAKYKDQQLFDLHWTTGSDHLRMVRRDRLQRHMELIDVTLPAGDIKVLLTESVENANLERQNVRYVKAGSDFLWWSERTGWGHYYLYDSNGNLKNPVTSGDWRAEGIVELDSLRGVVWVGGYGREPGENPYYRHLYKVNVNGTGIALLDPGETDHTSNVSPSKRYFVDNSSRSDAKPKAVLRDMAGATVMDLEEMDISQLEEMGWRPPERFVVKAADGVTDIYGNMFKPFDFDSTKKYPIIASVYPGPQTEQVSSTFSANPVQQRLAQLGFIVIQIGNRGGNPRRSNAYQNFSYFNLRDYGLADKKAGIEQLAAKYSWIDIDRVGIYGHSGGGFMTAAALMLPPFNDFFKVGVSSSGNHDNNVYNQNWSEQYHGLREVPAKDKNAVTDKAGSGNDGQADDQQAVETKFDIHVPTNAELAKNLKGSLLLVHGDMDNNVHTAGTIRLMNELIKANKRFDFMLMPGKPHGYGDMQPYFTRMLFEYFAEHLIGDYERADATIR